MGWADWPWYTTADDFSADVDVSEWFGITVFLRDGDEIYRSYYTTARAAEELSSVWGLLDIRPFGRWVDRIVGLDGVRVEFAMMQAPDGHGRLELIRFLSPSAEGGHPGAPANTPGIRHIAFVVEDIDAVVAGL